MRKLATLLGVIGAISLASAQRAPGSASGPTQSGPAGYQPTAQRSVGEIEEALRDFNRSQSPISLTGPTAAVIDNYGLRRDLRDQLQADANSIIQDLGLTVGLNSQQLRDRIRELDYQSQSRWVGNKPQEGQLLAAENELHFTFTEAKGQTRWNGELNRLFRGVSLSYNPKVLRLIGTVTVFNRQGIGTATRYAAVEVGDANIDLRIRQRETIHLTKQADTEELRRYTAARRLIEKLTRELQPTR